MVVWLLPHSWDLMRENFDARKDWGVENLQILLCLRCGYVAVPVL